MHPGTVIAVDTADDPPAGHTRSESSAAALAEAYWSERSGRLPPNRPVITRPTPEQSSHRPPVEGESGGGNAAVITVPGGRRR